MQEILVDENSGATITGFDKIESKQNERWRWALGGEQTIHFSIDNTPSNFFYKAYFPLANTQFTVAINGIKVQSTQIDEPRIVYGSVALPHLENGGEVALSLSVSKWMSNSEHSNGDSRPLAYAVERGFIREKKQHANPRKRKQWFLPIPFKKFRPLTTVYGIDAGYLIPAAVSIRSLLERSNPRQRKEIFILHKGVSLDQQQEVAQSLQEFKNFQLHWFAVDDSKFSNLKLGISYITSAAWFRFLMPAILPIETETALYLDSDTILLDAVEEIFDLYDPAFDIQACHDQLKTFKNLTLGQNNFSKFGIESSAPYFNSGVLLFNLKNWRDKKIADQVFSFADKHPECLSMAEQNVMNIVLYGSIGALPEDWNVQLKDLSTIEKNSASDLICGNLQTAKIFHYTTAWKPWGPGMMFPESGYYHDVASRTPWKIQN